MSPTLKEAKMLTSMLISALPIPKKPCLLTTQAMELDINLMFFTQR